MNKGCAQAARAACKSFITDGIGVGLNLHNNARKDLRNPQIYTNKQFLKSIGIYGLWNKYHAFPKLSMQLIDVHRLIPCPTSR